MQKETYTYARRDPYIWKEIPIHMERGTHTCVNRETNTFAKRDLYMCVQKQTHKHGKRDPYGYKEA